MGGAPVCFVSNALEERLGQGPLAAEDEEDIMGSAATFYGGMYHSSKPVAT